MKNTQINKYILKAKNNWQSVFMLSTVLIIIFLLGVITGQRGRVSKANPVTQLNNQNADNVKLQALTNKVFPQNGYVFNLQWKDLGKRMVDDGVIDEKKLAKSLVGDQPMPAQLTKYLDGSSQKIELNESNSHFWVNVLWALGLANKNEILESGPMVQNGNTANFASTGGYTIGQKQPMDIYNKYFYINLTDKQQRQVAEIASNIYRPCCGNSTAFPDCNHGMAALGLIELMVSQNKSTDEIYKTVLAFNSYWFAQTYLDIAYYFDKNERDYSKVPAKEILSKTFSSAMGYQVIRKKVGTISWPSLKSGGSCGA